MDWGQILANIVPVITIVGAFLLWLKNDIKQLRNDMNNNDNQLRDDMNAGFAAQEHRLRRVEMEQARVAGLLEGMALTGKLPDASA